MSHAHHAPRRGAGFSLIELMVAVAIAAILAAVAVPSYSEYVMRGRIPEATNGLSALRVQLEQYYQDNRTYVGACASGTVAPLPGGVNFTFSCPTLTATAFTAQASGTGSMANFVYTVNESNARQTTRVPNTGWGSTPAACWIVRKGGGC
ncbi:type IV pilin protein [Noviherbaspirillum sp. 1P10PC]|uniref:type IV pilin protein n=1 Tax=Noviherbaspirillum sp. 1P10PC TaxID=3132292 RepID=UPI0039A2D063